MRLKINLLAVLNWGFFVLMGLLFLNAFFFNRSTAFIFTFGGQMQNFVIVTAIFCLLAIITYIVAQRYKSIVDFMQKKHIYVVYGVMLAIFILQIIYAFLIHSSLEYDVELIIWNAQARNPDEFVWIEYFSLYPNNFMILFFFRFIYSVLTLFRLEEHFVHALVIVNIVFVNAAIVLVFHAVKSAFDVFKGYVAWIFMLLLVAFSPWIIVPYSDTLSMPIAAGIVYLYVKFRDADKGRKIAYALSIGAVAQIGYFIKPSSVIPLIAIILIQLILDLRAIRANPKPKYSRSKNTRTGYNIKYLAIYTISAMVIVSAIFNSFVRSQNAIPFIEGVAFPPEHWIKMGMQRQAVGDRFSYGAYNADDFFFTASFSSTQEMRRADREVIRERLSDFGVIGYSHFLVNKLRWITGDGTFHWGEFARGNFEEMTPMQSHFKNLVHRRGENYANFAYFKQSIWLFILFWHFVYAFRKKDSSNVVINVSMCAIIGLFMFILLTEGRSRYLINHLPLFTITSAYCFSSMFDRVKVALESRNHRH